MVCCAAESVAEAGCRTDPVLWTTGRPRGERQVVDMGRSVVIAPEFIFITLFALAVVATTIADMVRSRVRDQGWAAIRVHRVRIASSGAVPRRRLIWRCPV